jgi:uncharacterized protein (DUF1499 family)
MPIRHPQSLSGGDLSATSNTVIRTFYERLLTSGVEDGRLTACMRKPLVIITMVTKVKWRFTSLIHQTLATATIVAAFLRSVPRWKEIAAIKIASPKCLPSLSKERLRNDSWRLVTIPSCR